MRYLLATALAVMLALPVAAQDFQKGFEAYQRGDYATALWEWRPLAEQGDAVAQNNLGVMYENGQGVAQDFAEALKWYRKSAEQGYVVAQHNLGLMYGKRKERPRRHDGVRIGESGNSGRYLRGFWPSSNSWPQALQCHRGICSDTTQPPR